MWTITSGQQLASCLHTTQEFRLRSTHCSPRACRATTSEQQLVALQQQLSAAQQKQTTTQRRADAAEQKLAGAEQKLAAGRGACFSHERWCEVAVTLDTGVHYVVYPERCAGI